MQTPEPILTVILRRIEAGDPIKHIARDANVDAQTIYNHYGPLIKARTSARAASRDAAILAAYQRHGQVKAVIEEVGTCAEVVQRVLERHGIERRRNGPNQHARKHVLNETYFDQVDTEEKAYYLGLLCADGCVSIRVCGKKRRVSIHTMEIGLKGEDRPVLARMSHVLYGADRLVPITYPDGRGKDAYRLSVNSKHMCESLVRLGCTPRKSLTLQFPTEEQVPKHLVHHFLRGYFDGDGTVGTYEGYKRAGFVSSHAFIDALRKTLVGVVGNEGSLSRGERRYSVVTYGRKEVVLRLRDYLYEGATVWMERKRERFYA